MFKAVRGASWLYFHRFAKEIGVWWGRKHLYLNYVEKHPKDSRGPKENVRERTPQARTWQMIPFSSEMDGATDLFPELSVNEERNDAKFCLSIPNSWAIMLYNDQKICILKTSDFPIRSWLYSAEPHAGFRTQQVWLCISTFGALLVLLCCQQ